MCQACSRWWEKKILFSCQSCMTIRESQGTMPRSELRQALIVAWLVNAAGWLRESRTIRDGPAVARKYQTFRRECQILPAKTGRNTSMRNTKPQREYQVLEQIPNYWTRSQEKIPDYILRWNRRDTRRVLCALQAQNTKLDVHLPPSKSILWGPLRQ